MKRSMSTCESVASNRSELKGLKLSETIAYEKPELVELTDLCVASNWGA